MKARHFLLIGSLAAFAVSIVSTGMALAGDRYGSQPPVQVSPRVYAPWEAQLLNEPLRAAMIPAAAPDAVESPKQKRKSAYRAVSYQRPAANPATTTRKHGMDPAFLPQEVSYDSKESPGTIVIDPKQHFLYYVETATTARRYGIAVGRQGLQFTGTATIQAKREWPRWIPTKEMVERDPAHYGRFKNGMDGGPGNPLGSRAMYLYQGNKDTYIRIHGTVEPWSIGKSASNGCFRMINEDVMDLYSRVSIGTEVVVL